MNKTLHPEMGTQSEANPSTAVGAFLRASRLRRDEELAEVDRATLVDKYAVRAMELLTEARTAGYFKEAKNIAHAKDTDTDLDPLRDRDDFKQLLKGLEEDLQK